MDLEKINLMDIVPAEYNPRKISDEELDKLKKSIGEFGLVDPIIINLNNNRIIGGHQRYEVLLNQHMENNSYGELNLIRLGDVGWVFTEDDLKVESEEHEKALNVTLNKISGEWDFDKLDDLLVDLDNCGFDVSLTGFDELELHEELCEDNVFLDEEDIPNFQPVEDDGTRLDMKNQYSIYVKLNNEYEQNKLCERLVNEGYKCKKN